MVAAARSAAVSALPAAAVDETELRRRLEVLTLEQKVRLLTGHNWWAMNPEPAIGLGRLVMSDGPAGVRGELWDERDPSINIPSGTALAATWDVQRIQRIGRLLAGEARRKGVDVVLAPTVNLHRTPYGGRHFECFSEDPLLTGVIGAAYVRGLQSGGVAATVKHFVGNETETNRFTYDAIIDERTLVELYLAPFDHIVNGAGVWAVMAAYNSVNGYTMTEHPMLAAVLHTWGFDGIVVSDWYAARDTIGAGNAALDIAMPGPPGPFGDALVAAVRAGSVSAAAVDDKVLRFLRLAARVGRLDGFAPVAGAETPQSEEAVAAELRSIATAGFVLVKNDGDVLPLRRDELRRVALIGPNAEVARTLGGGSATVFPPYTISPLDGLRAALGPDVQVDVAVGVTTHTKLQVASARDLIDPATGQPGLEVRFLAADGTVLGTEHRSSGGLFWTGNFGGNIPVAEVDAIEVRGRLRARQAGDWTVGVQGVGAFVVSIDGEPLIDTVLAAPAGWSIVEPGMHPPVATTLLSLAEGAEHEVSVRHQVQDGTSIVALAFCVQAPPRDAGADLAAAVALAAASDVAIVVVGTNAEVESEGFDRETLALPGKQDELVRQVLAVNPRTIVVVNAGSPVLMPWADNVPAVLLSWFAGQEYGNALADVLLGAEEPGGRLPTTWPAVEGSVQPSVTPIDGRLVYGEGLHIGHRAYAKAGVEPRYWFGHGLGYTDWEYAAFTVPDRVDAGSELVVRAVLRNTGERAGSDVVQVYVSRRGSGIERPVRWLGGFGRVVAEAGRDAIVDIAVPARAFQHYDAATHTWELEPGAFTVAAGRSYGDLRAEATVVVG